MKIHSYIFSLLACLVIALPGYSQVDRNETLIRSALHGLEYEQTLYTGVYRDSKLCGTFERSGISAVHRQHLFICFCDLHIKDRSGVSSGAGAGEEGGRQRDTQNHLLRALRYQYHCGGRTV